MHELSICQALIEQVEATARKEGALQVVQVRVGIGPLAGVEPQLLQHLPVRVSCRECGQETGAEVANLACGKCGDWHTELVSGDEMLLTQVELVRDTSVGKMADATIN